MKHILLLALVVAICGYISALPLHKIEGRCVELKDFSKTQKEVILKAFKYGLKSGYAYTMAAIAWKESCAGAYRVNFADPSAGIYHAHIPGLLKKNNQKDTGFMRNMVGELLINDDEYASQVALDELLYWHKVRNGNWKDVIKSYNKGFSWENDIERNKLAQNYYEDIARRIKDLQDYMPRLAPSLFKQAKNDKALAFVNQDTKSPIYNEKQKPKKLDSTRSAQIQTTSNQKIQVKQNFMEVPKNIQPSKKRSPYTGEFYLLQER